QANEHNPNGRKIIYMKNIDMDDTQNCWYLLPELRLLTPTSSLFQPSPGPGAPSSKTDGLFSQLALADSSFVLNFVKDSIGGSPNGNSLVYHIYFHGWLNYLERWTEDWEPKHGEVTLQWWPKLGQGQYPHSTQTPVLTENRDWFIHNRVYQSAGDYIRTGAKMFLKGEQDKETIFPMLTISDSVNTARISEIYSLNSSGYNAQRIKMAAFKTDDNDRIVPKDTITSEWFHINELREFAFFTTIFDTSLFELTLERYGQKKSVSIPMFRDDNEYLSSKKIAFLNGRNQKYRFKLIRKNEYTHTWVDLVLDDYRELGSNFAEYGNRELAKVYTNEINGSHQIIDLADNSFSQEAELKIQVYPNPASEFMYVIATNSLTDGAEELNFTLYNSVGSKIKKFTGKCNDVYTLDCAELPSGIYFLKVASNLIDETNMNIKTQTVSLIITR
ncbi:MAG: T9SS type A sorting domain-containing protein, partial [Candidatus Kapabacteria bacterium]|nr:T9SS type A sorting domain-containing protein [Candidatus Kapabacteria bacterium]